MTSEPNETCAVCGLPLEAGQSGLCNQCEETKQAHASMEKRIVKSPFEEMNPILSIWTRPRETIRHIVTHDPNHMVLLLAALGGILSVLDKASMKSYGDRYPFPMIIIMALILGPIVGIIGLYIYSALLRWTGKWIGGQASPEEIRAAWAWSHVIVIGGGLLWLPELAIFGQEMFTTATPSLDADPFKAILLIILSVGQLAFGIWWVVVFLKCLSEVQQFSIGKAVLNALLPTLVIVVPIGLLIAGFVLLGK